MLFAGLECCELVHACYEGFQKQKGQAQKKVNAAPMSGKDGNKSVTLFKEKNANLDDPPLLPEESIL